MSDAATIATDLRLIAAEELAELVTLKPLSGGALAVHAIRGERPPVDPGTAPGMLIQGQADDLERITWLLAAITTAGARYQIKRGDTITTAAGDVAVEEVVAMGPRSAPLSYSVVTIGRSVEATAPGVPE